MFKDETQTWLTPPPPPPDNGSVSIHIQPEGEVGGDMEVEPSQVEVVFLPAEIGQGDGGGDCKPSGQPA